MRLILPDGAVDLDGGAVVRGGVVTRLTVIERELLVYLAARAGRDVPRAELHDQVWRHARRVVSRAADFTIHRLRRKIEVAPGDPRCLVTGIAGYRWVPAEADDQVARAVLAADRVALLVAEPARPGDAGSWRSIGASRGSRPVISMRPAPCSDGRRNGSRSTACGDAGPGVCPAGAGGHSWTQESITTSVRSRRRPAVP